MVTYVARPNPRQKHESILKPMAVSTFRHSTTLAAALVSTLSVACNKPNKPTASNTPSSATSSSLPPVAPTITAAPGATSATLSPRTNANGVLNPYDDQQPKLPSHVAMQLPQPLPEPTEAQEPAQYAPANPAWPAALSPIYGSELVARVKASGKRGVLINAWASWCGPCRVEMPMLVELRNKYLERGIDVWFVSVNQSSEAEQVVQVLKERNVPKPHYVAKGIIGYFIDALSPIWQGSLPSTFLYDGNGKLRYFWGAHVFEQEITPILDDFLAGKPVDGVANVQVRKGPGGPQ